MTMTRRDFLAASSATLAACATPFGGIGGAAVAVDALVIGGGVQGLAVLDRLRAQGFSVALVTHAPLGAGQTLHNHGLLNSGYPYPSEALRSTVKNDWIPFARERGLELYGADRSFLLTPSAPSSGLRGRWDEFGYEHEAVEGIALPTGIRASEGTHITRIREFNFPKRQLVRLLAKGAEDRIIHGRIDAVRLSPDSSRVQSVTVVRSDEGGSLTIQPRLIVTAAGGGSRRLIETLAGGAETAMKMRAVNEVDDIVCRNIHMICVRGPRSLLPHLNLLAPAHRLVVVGASVDHNHDAHTLDPDAPVTWYVTPLDPKAQPAASAPAHARAPVEERLVAQGMQSLQKLCPALVDPAANGKIEFAVYAGYKQELRDANNRPVARRLESLDNVVVTLPTVIPGAFANANRVLKMVGAAVNPSGRQPRLPGVARELPLGEVTENTDHVEWMDWARLLDAYPSLSA
jgi:glycine/D-amino acid oxidase-like deaminating enzyme